MIAAALTIGCNGDFAEADSAGTYDTDSGDTDAGTGERSTTDPSGGTDDGHGSTATSPTEPTTTGDSGTGEAPGPSACDELECGNGECELGDDDGPRCVCDEGYMSIGLGCVPCGPVAAGLGLDVPIADVEVLVTINGAMPPQSVFEDGWVYLRNLATGDEVQLGQSSDENGRITATVIPGAYEAFWGLDDGGAQVPTNRSASLGFFEVDNDTILEVDVPMVTFVGEFKLDGEPAPGNEFESARIYLKNSRTGDEVFLGETADGSFSVNVVPGTYDVIYEVEAGGTLVPTNGHHIVLRGFEVEDVGIEVAFDRDIELTSSVVSGTVTLDGAAPPSSDFEKGGIIYRDVETGDEIAVGDTADGSYSARLLTGTYEIYYGLEAGGAQVPVNSHARLGPSVALLAGEQTIDIDIPTRTVTGDFLVDGAAAPADPGDDGTVSLGNTETGDLAYLGNTHEGSFSRMVVQGTYEVFFSQETPGGTMPANTLGLMPIQIDVGAQGSFDVDIPTALISGTISLDGATPPESEYDDGRLYLQNTATGDSVLLGNTRSAFFSRLVVPGTYDVVYVVETAGPDVPVNAAATLDQGIEIADGTVLDVDIPVVQLTGSLTLGGQPPNNSSDERGRVFLEDVNTADEIYLGATWDTSFDQPLAAGRYLVRYRSLESSGNSPSNVNAGFACFELAD